MPFPKEIKKVSGIEVKKGEGGAVTWAIDGVYWSFKGGILEQAQSSWLPSEAVKCETLFEAVGYSRGYSASKAPPPVVAAKKPAKPIAPPEPKDA